MGKLSDNKLFDEEEDPYRILEGAEFDVEEMMDSPSLIDKKTSGSREDSKHT